MKDIADLKSDAEYALRRALEIQEAADKEGRVTTDEEKRTINELRLEAKDAREQVKAIKENERLANELKADYEEFKTPGKRQTTSTPVTADPFPEKARIEIPSYAPRNMRVFRDSGRGRQYDEEMAFKFGCFVAGTVGKADWAKRRLREFANNERAMSEGSNTGGGFTVPEQMTDYIIRLVEDYSVALREGNVVPMTRDVMTVPRRTSGLTVYNTAEGGAPTESTMGWDQVRLTANKAGVYTAYSAELAEDSAIAIAEIVGLEIGQAMGQKLDTCLFMGDGTNGNFGITGVVTKIEALSSTSWANVHSVPINTFAEITSASLGAVSGNVMGSVKQGGNCKYFISPQGFDKGIGAVLAGLGGVTMAEGAGPRPMRYNGYEVVQVAVMREESSGTISDDLAMLLFGDLRRSATIGLRRALEIKSSDQFLFTSDSIAVVGFMRFDIVTHDVGGLISAGVDAKPPIAALISDAS